MLSNKLKVNRIPPSESPSNDSESFEARFGIMELVTNPRETFDADDTKILFAADSAISSVRRVYDGMTLANQKGLLKFNDKTVAICNQMISDAVKQLWGTLSAVTHSQIPSEQKVQLIESSKQDLADRLARIIRFGYYTKALTQATPFWLVAGALAFLRIPVWKSIEQYLSKEALAQFFVSQTPIASVIFGAVLGVLMRIISAISQKKLEEIANDLILQPSPFLRFCTASIVGCCVMLLMSTGWVDVSILGLKASEATKQSGIALLLGFISGFSEDWVRAKLEERVSKSKI